MSSSSTGNKINWDALQDAYGPATEVPKCLERVCTAKGSLFHEALGDLCSRIIHQGTIYSSSPPACAVLVDALARGPQPPVEERSAAFVQIIAEISAAARKAIADGRAIPCCAGGDPVDGEAIRTLLREHHDLFVSFLASTDVETRIAAVDVLTAFPDLPPRAQRTIEDFYRRETDAAVRRQALEGLSRSQLHPAFIADAVRTETDSFNQFLLRRGKITANIEAADSVAISELVSEFTNCDRHAGAGGHYHVDGSQEFFSTLALLGKDREIAALLESLEKAVDPGVVRCVAERLLRTVFDDARTGWGQTSHGRDPLPGEALPPRPGMIGLAFRALGFLLLHKLFPPAARWLIRRRISVATSGKPWGIERIDYWGLQGDNPDIPMRLDPLQAQVLRALASKPQLWSFHTNLWKLFDLPDTAEGLQQLVNDRTATG